ncbi:MAG: hypothetical protein HGA24_00805 [Candidatus Aminicenantes bacterium]|nr:hypothetical protein [Candidatus Aminicenantes bacterium]
MKRPGLVIALAVWLSGLAGSCRPNVPADASKFAIESLEGVRHIQNHAPQIEGPPPVQLELVAKIGELEGLEDKDILYDPVDATRLPNGDILVLEGDGCTVKRFNGHRQLVSSFGGKGLGPGDFVSPHRLGLNAGKDRIYVADDSRVSWFRLDGRFVGSFKCRAARLGGSNISQRYRTSGMSLLSDAHIILPADVSLWEEAGAEALLTVYDGEGTAVRSFGAVTRFDDPLMTLNANIVYFVTDNADNCYVAFAHQNRLDKYSRDGELLFSADRRLPYEIRTEMKDEVFTSGPMQRVFSWPSVTSVAKGAAADGKGRIWVLTYLIQPNRFGGFDNQDDISLCYRFDVFDPQGILQFSVSPPNVRFSGFSITDDRLYLVDPGDESCVYEYRILYRD